MSPIVDRQDGFVFYFYSKDLGERPHVHVGIGSQQPNDGKIWLDTLTIETYGYLNAHKMGQALKIVVKYQTIYLRKWASHAANR